MNLSLTPTDVHHLRGAIATLTLALAAIKEGERFEDATGELKIQAIESAIERLRVIAYNLSDE